MKKLSLVLSIAITATVAGAVLASGDTDAAILNQISNYREWTRVNEEPVKVQVPLITTGGTFVITSERMSVAS